MAEKQGSKFEPKTSKDFIVRFAAAPYNGRVNGVKAMIHNGDNTIRDRDDALVLLRYPGAARFRALDAVEAGLVSMAELKGLGYPVPIDVDAVNVEVRVVERLPPDFGPMSNRERQEWSERLGVVLPVKETHDQHCDRLRVAWIDRNKET